MIRTFLVSLSSWQKCALQAVADLVLLSLALWLAFYLRLGSRGWILPEGKQWALFVAAPVIAISVYIMTGMYQAVIRSFGSRALLRFFCAITLGFLVFLAAYYLANWFGWKVLMPRSTQFSFWSLSLMFVGGLRLVAREYFLGYYRLPYHPVPSTAAQTVVKGIPAVIYGAGAAGMQLLSSLRLGRLYRPVAFVDDNASLWGRQVDGLRVYGPHDMQKMIDSTEAQEIFLAIPSARRSRRQQILMQLQDYPLHVKTMPGFMDIASGKVKVDELQEVDIADLLGRDQVVPEVGLLERCIRAQAVMVTGAGGSIGSELCRQIVALKPTTLVLYEHSEFALYAIHNELQRMIDTCGSEVTLVPILGSIRNGTRLRHVMDSWQVNTVYHAAAYKHVPLVEHNIAEGIMNNVFGTLKVAEAAVWSQVSHFVLVSTDKAVRPTNVMGATKRLAELVLQALSCEKSPEFSIGHQNLQAINRTRFTMVRFGNVLGSSGSVIPLFRNQLRNGGPVTVTHPEMTRYFMTIPEAAQLVIQAGSMGESGNVYVLDMGEPVSILDMARKMIKLAGLSVRDAENPDGDIEIVFTGLRPGEKLYEELLIGDQPESTAHPKIFKANEAYIKWGSLQVALEALYQAVEEEAFDEVRQILLDIVQGYNPGDYQIVDYLFTARQGVEPVPLEQ